MAVTEKIRGFQPKKRKTKKLLIWCWIFKVFCKILRCPSLIVLSICCRRILTPMKKKNLQILVRNYNSRMSRT
eukprot:UN11544